MKRPSFQFYPGDWMRDTALRSCSVGARGLWMDMICLMHEGTPYGYLKVNHKVILSANLARMVGATLHDTEGWLDELRAAGVFSENDSDGIHSRRMIRDEDVRMRRAEGGVKGGNPALMPPKKRKVNLNANLPPTPSSSSSSPSASSPSSSIAQNEWEGLPEELNAEDFKTEWQTFIAYRKKKRLAALLPESVVAQWVLCATWGKQVAIESIKDTIRNGWQGLFPPKGNNGSFRTKPHHEPSEQAQQWIDQLTP